MTTSVYWFRLEPTLSVCLLVLATSPLPYIKHYLYHTCTPTTIYSIGRPRPTQLSVNQPPHVRRKTYPDEKKKKREKKHETNVFTDAYNHYLKLEKTVPISLTIYHFFRLFNQQPRHNCFMQLAGKATWGVRYAPVLRIADIRIPSIR